MFIKGTAEEQERHVPEFTVIDVPRFHAIPSEDETNSETFIIINFTKKLVLIGGTSYAGEIKKIHFQRDELFTAIQRSASYAQLRQHERRR